MNKILTLITTFALTGSVYAQNYQDIVRYSRLTNFGTARSAAMGGAFTALGGDLSAISYNPASVGVFRKSEFGTTLNMDFAHAKSGNTTAKNNSFQLGDMGGVLAFYSPSFDWKGINFGFNYTNMNNFNRKVHQEVPYSENSITDVFAAQAGNTNSDYLDAYTTGLAYDTYLINPDEEGYYVSVLGLNEPIFQSKRIKEKGYQGEYAFSFGTNYKDKLYLGLTLGIQSIRYKKESVYQEAPGLDSPSGLDFFNFYDYEKTSGVGTNVKFGAIYRPIPEIRIGAAIHTPTWYNMTYRMSTRIYSQFINDMDPSTDRVGFEFDAKSGEFSVDYNMRTPWRAIVGVATVLGQKAIISVDYEYIKYNASNYSEASDGYDYSNDNEAIKAYLRPTHNFRAGAEYRATNVVSVRAGYSFWNSPYYNTESKSENRVQSISAGIGLNFGVFYCDAAYVHKYSKDWTAFYGYYAENPEYDILAQPVHNKYFNNEARLTFGVRF